LVFFKEDGTPIRSLKYPYTRWRFVVETLGIRYRELYNTRHSCVSWHLLTGKNLLWCSPQHGHSVPMMLSTYGIWIEGSTTDDVEAIKSAMNSEATATRLQASQVPSTAQESPKNRQ
jgi:hypothetical protein